MLYSIIKNGEWHWKSAHLDNLVEIQCRLLETLKSNTGSIPALKLGTS